MPSYFNYFIKTWKSARVHTHARGHTHSRSSPCMLTICTGLMLKYYIQVLLHDSHIQMVKRAEIKLISARIIMKETSCFSYLWLLFQCCFNNAGYYVWLISHTYLFNIVITVMLITYYTFILVLRLFTKDTSKKQVVCDAGSYHLVKPPFADPLPLLPLYFTCWPLFP